MHNKI
jgi:hypothetical protein